MNDRITIGTARRTGRPPLGDRPKRRHQVMLHPAIAKALRRAGRGNLSRGIEIAAKLL